MSKPREFWITTDFEEVLFSDEKTSAFAFEKNQQDEETIHVIEKAPIDKLLDEVEQYMKNICGDRCAEQNPCANKEVLRIIQEFRSNE